MILFIQKSYIYGAGLISQGGTTTTSRNYYLEDGQGNIRFVTDSTGAKLRSTEYDPFGNWRAANGQSNIQMLYQGQQQDPESNLYYLRARYYDTTTGRFISKDPVEGTLGNPQSQNGYNYANDNPVNFSDPLGLYTNANLSGGDLGIGISCGVIFDNGNVHPYVGVGVMEPGLSISYTGAPGSATLGKSYSVGFTKNYNAAGSVNYSPSDNSKNAEAGVVIGAGAKTAASVTETYTFDSFGSLIDNIIPKAY